MLFQIKLFRKLQRERDAEIVWKVAQDVSYNYSKYRNFWI